MRSAGGPARARSRCADCDAPFHLNLRTDLPLPSCGAAVVGQACGYSLLCNPCIERDEPAAGVGGAVRLRVL